MRGATGWAMGFMVLAATGLATACGGDTEDTGATGGTAGAAGASAGGAGGAGATGGAGGAGATGGAGGTAGTGGTGGTSSCVATNCPALGQFAQGCCKTDGTCGYDGSALGQGCLSQEDLAALLDGGLDAGQPPADAGDPNCADLPGLPVVGTLIGCCSTTALCGWFIPFLNQCLDAAQIVQLAPQLAGVLPDSGPPQSCGGGTGGAGGGGAGGTGGGASGAGGSGTGGASGAGGSATGGASGAGGSAGAPSDAGAG